MSLRNMNTDYVHKKSFNTEGEQFQSRAAKNSKNRERSFKTQSHYNLKDFLPQQTHFTRNRNKSTLQPRTEASEARGVVDVSNILHNQRSRDFQTKLFEKKMNAIKEENINLKSKLEEEEAKNKEQAKQIGCLKAQIQQMQLKQSHKKQALSLWSYKNHIQIQPVIKHKYSISVQTEDKNSRVQSTKKLKAKDFEDIYRRLNSNKSMVNLQKKRKTSKSPLMGNFSEVIFNVTGKTQAKASKSSQRQLPTSVSNYFKVPNFSNVFSQEIEDKENFSRSANFIENEDLFKDKATYKIPMDFEFWKKNTAENQKEQDFSLMNPQQLVGDNFEGAFSYPIRNELVEGDKDEEYDDTQN